MSFGPSRVAFQSSDWLPRVSVLFSTKLIPSRQPGRTPDSDVGESNVMRCECANA
jgi:hypothetical protein